MCEICCRLWFCCDCDTAENAALAAAMARDAAAARDAADLDG